MPQLILPYAVLAAVWAPHVHDEASARRAHAVVAGDEAHLVVAEDGTTTPLRPVLADVPGRRVIDVGALLPGPGHVAGVPGVALDLALESEQCLLVATDAGRWAVVPEVTTFGSVLEPGTMVRWHVRPLPPGERGLPTLLGLVGSLGQARREISTALIEAVDALEALDVARWHEDAVAELAGVVRAELPAHLLPPGIEERRAEVLTRAARVLAITELAATDDGAAVTLAQASARSRVLADLALVARRAMAAASVTSTRA
ncbi:hypothetical protein V2J56_07675 [Georgenia sp. MJ206]|uniref:hypothetical protein n=1 Tax=Georgenia wangjunii TaxID=3117730 RepID=UPI002F25FAF2